MQLVAQLKLAFASAPELNSLTLLHIITRRPVLQKVRDHTGIATVVLSQLVSIWFQVLFHSPPGVLFNFPSQYYALSVTWSYLALGDGPPTFTPDFSCPVLLWILTGKTKISLTRLLLCFVLLSSNVQLFLFSPCVSPNPKFDKQIWFGLLPFRSPLLRQSLIYFLFLQVLRCFSSLRSLHYTMYSCI